MIQVLDDSDDESIQQLIKGEVSKWRQQGINIIYQHRLIRTCYKAGNLKSAKSCDYVKDYEFVADMDIAVRAHLNGWKFIYLNDVESQEKKNWKKQEDTNGDVQANKGHPRDML
ncbi:Glycosyltransferase 2-like domain-containing protein [Forsythia ovata]